jgi:cytochrome P450
MSLTWHFPTIASWPSCYFQHLLGVPGREYGPVVGLLLGGERVVLVADPAAARQVLIDDASDVFVKAGTAFFPGSSLTGNGLLVSDGETWRRQRRMTNPAFRKAAVDRSVRGGGVGRGCCCCCSCLAFC